MKRKSIEEIKQYLKENTKLKLLSTVYNNRKHKLLFECECGDLFETTLESILTSEKTHCNKCSLEKISKRFAIQLNGLRMRLKID